LFDDIIKQAPKDAQWRIAEYVKSATEEETVERLQRLYGVKDAREMASHLTQYECGQRYPVDDKLIKDYKLFWEVVDSETEKHRIIGGTE